MYKRQSLVPLTGSISVSESTFSENRLLSQVDIDCLNSVVPFVEGYVASSARTFS